MVRISVIQIASVSAFTLATSLLPAGSVDAGPTRQDQVDKREAPGCVGIQVETPGRESRNPRRNRQRGPVFSATEILDLEFQVFFSRRLAGPHAVELKIYTPKGHLYQALNVPFTIEDSGQRDDEKSEKKQTRKVEGYPHPVEEAEVKRVRTRQSRYYQVSSYLPVAGTSIVTNSLYGRWKVEAYVDGQADPCARPFYFQIQQ